MRAARTTVQQVELALEEIIHYRKTIEVRGRDETQDKYWVRDVLRINVRHFLVRLDESREKIAFFDAEGVQFRSKEVPHVYHLNAIIRLSRQGSDGRTLERLERMRIVLDKAGIVRIEHVEARGPTALPVAKRPLRIPVRLRNA
jgi:hypothetical protein